jgi:hypothetical protein
MNPEHKNDDCPCSCSECYLLGDSVPEWPRKKECKKLDEMLKATMESEGGIATDVESDTRILDDTRAN